MTRLPYVRAWAVALLLAGLASAQNPAEPRQVPVWSQNPTQNANQFPSGGNNQIRQQPVTDWNNNGIPDHLETLGYRDWNKNGIPDHQERITTPASQKDWNFDGIPDHLQQNQIIDWNGNGIPDQYEGGYYNPAFFRAFGVPTNRYGVPLNRRPVTPPQGQTNRR